MHGLGGAMVAMSEDAKLTSAASDGVFRVLSLDGGGAKGFYTLGVLKELEAMLGGPLFERFDLVYGTSTGAIIAALIALGNNVDAIHELYKEHVPKVMGVHFASQRSEALLQLGDQVFKEDKFDAFKTRIGIVATRWMLETPMIFKANPEQAHGRPATFAPGFGCKISDAIQASCSAVPFFHRKTVTTSAGDNVDLIDGGCCANNPTLYAIADATKALKVLPENLRVLNVGVGMYPEPKPRNPVMWAAKKLQSVQMWQKTMEINTQSMEQLRKILFGHIATIRISEAFTEPALATDLLENDLKKLNLLRQRGSASFANFETDLRMLLL
jgi:patatin-like phospholipase/acyl hydrolase